MRAKEVWIPNEDMNPLVNISGRPWRTADGQSGVFQGDWYGPVIKDSLEWLFLIPEGHTPPTRESGQ